MKMADAEWHRITVREISLDELVAEKRRILGEYEKRYAMPSAEMAALVDSDAIVPDVEVIKWYHACDWLKFLLATTLTTGTPGTTTSTSTTAG